MTPRPFAQHVELLSDKSVSKHFDAYEDVDWDSHEVSPRDPVFIAGEQDALGRTDWYRSLLPEMQSQLGLHRIVFQMHLGAIFENVLSRGLLNLAATQDCRSAQTRYAYHEVIEESQHTLMFHEFVRRSGCEVFPLPMRRRFSSNLVPQLGRHFPELFFIFVLGGEAPIDFMQRKALSDGSTLHPLVRRVIRIHVTEEARHLSFAHRYLEEHVPQLGTVKRTLLAAITPRLVHEMTKDMLELPPPLVQRYGIPKEVVAQIRHDERYLADRREALVPVRRTLHKLGLLGAPFDGIWRRLQLA